MLVRRGKKFLNRHGTTTVWDERSGLPLVTVVLCGCQSTKQQLSTTGMIDPSQATGWKCWPSILPNSCKMCGRVAARVSEPSNCFWNCIWIIRGLYCRTGARVHVASFNFQAHGTIVGVKLPIWGHLQDDQRPAEREPVPRCEYWWTGPARARSGCYVTVQLSCSLIDEFSKYPLFRDKISPDLTAQAFQAFK